MANVSSQLCACNCGQFTNVARQNRPEFGHIKGQPCRFLPGHNRAGGRKPGYVSHLRKLPFEGCFNALKSAASARGYEVSMSFEDFVQMTQTTECHYCAENILWEPHNNGAYNLDRKDNTVGYTKENVVVCCGRCNRGKGFHFTYEEWVCMTVALRKLKGI